VAETPVITGAGVAAELTDTLSNVAVASDEVLPLFTTKPIYTFGVMLTVLVSHQGPIHPVRRRIAAQCAPLRTSSIQYGAQARQSHSVGVFPPSAVRTLNSTK